MRFTRRECLTGLGAIAVAGPRAAAAADTQVLTAADVHPKGYPTVEAVKFIGERLAQQTAGRLQIRQYYSGQLGREPDTVDLARLGALTMTRVNFASLNNPFPLTQVFSLPYVFDSVEHMRRVVDGQVGKQILDCFASRDLVGLAIYDAGMRCFYNVRRPIVHPRDLLGLKIRVPPSDGFIHFVRALGANPTPLPVNEVYSALQTHLIEGAENNWRTFHSSRQFEVAKFWAQSEHSHSPEALLMSRKVFDSLSKSDQELLLSCARESVPYMRQLWDRMDAESREAALKGGVKVTEIDRAAFREAVQPVVRHYLERNDLHSLYDSIRNLA